jgi:hypothetical protein
LPRNAVLAGSFWADRASRQIGRGVFGQGAERRSPMTANPTVLAGLCPDPAHYHSNAHPEAPSCGNKSQDIRHVERLNAGIVQGVHQWEKTQQNDEDTADRDAPFAPLLFRKLGIFRLGRHCCSDRGCQFGRARIHSGRNSNATPGLRSCRRKTEIFPGSPRELSCQSPTFVQDATPLPYRRHRDRLQFAREPDGAGYLARLDRVRPDDC